MRAPSAFSDWRATGSQWLQTVVELSPDLIKRLCVAGARKVREWWLEILVLAAPFVVLGVLARVPEIAASLRGEASIGTVAAVQGAVTGLSLIALVLAVELARRQEDRDDTVYEIMLKAAWIRPTFIFAISALLATLTAIAIVDFSVVTQGEQSANLLLCAYVLTGAVGLALLFAVLRTVYVLRPTGVIEYRFNANDQERSEKVTAFLSRSMNEYPKLDPVERVLLPHRPIGLTATERLFVEIDDALETQHSARFSGALQRLRQLVMNSADQISGSGLGFQGPGQPHLGYWFPLDALHGRLRELWRAAFARQGSEFTREMWAFEYWLVMTGIEKQSGELVELGLRSGLIGYQAAREAGRSDGHVRREWLNLRTAAWRRLRPSSATPFDPKKEVYLLRLIEYFQEYGNLLLVSGDSQGFRELLAGFSEAFFDREKRAWIGVSFSGEQSGQLTSFEYSVLALLALVGRAMTLRHQGKLPDISEHLDLMDKMGGRYAPLDRFVPAAYEPERPLHQQWGWWEIDSEEMEEAGFRWMASEQYVLLPLLLELLKSESEQPLPSLHGYAQRLIDAWDKHQNLLLDMAGIELPERELRADSLSARLATAKAAEERETEDAHLAAELDDGRVTRFLERMKSERRADRAIESYFQDTGRVRRISEEEWGDAGRFGRGWPCHDHFSYVTSLVVPTMRKWELTHSFEDWRTVLLRQWLSRLKNRLRCLKRQAQHSATC